MPCNELTLFQRKKSWRDSAEAASSGKGWPTHPAALANLLQHLQHQLHRCFPIWAVWFAKRALIFFGLHIGTPLAPAGGGRYKY
jgi:hypothetical protein